MQVILDSSFARPGRAPIWGGKKEEFRDWTNYASECSNFFTQMPSSESHEELETLLNMEMKLRLLDLENITIPETPPQVPAEPPNFNFVYDFS